jgi:hypothetical protein
MRGTCHVETFLGLFVNAWQRACAILPCAYLPDRQSKCQILVTTRRFRLAYDNELEAALGKTTSNRHPGSRGSNEETKGSLMVPLPRGRLGDFGPMRNFVCCSLSSGSTKDKLVESQTPRFYANEQQPGAGIDCLMAEQCRGGRWVGP